MKRFSAPSSIERLAVSMERCEVGPDGLTVRGIASVFGNLIDAWVPSVMEPGAFTKTLSERRLQDIPFLWQHDVEEVLGLPTMLRESDRGLEFEARIIPTQANKDRAMLIQAGAVRGVSIGFDPIKHVMEDRGNGDVLRRLKEVRLWEFSAVTFAADSKAKILDVFAVVPYQDLPLASRTMGWDRSAAEARLRAWAEAEDGPNAQYRRAFVWFDADDSDNFGAYKLPIADVIEGKLTAVPRGIVAAAAAVQGARGGVSIPEGELGRVRAHLGRYYRKMAAAFDDDSIKAPWEADAALLNHLEWFEADTRLWAIGLALCRLPADDPAVVQQAITALHGLIPSAEPPEPSALEVEALTARRRQQLTAAELDLLTETLPS